MSSGRGQALWNAAQQLLEQLAEFREGRVHAVFVFELVCCWCLDLLVHKTRSCTHSSMIYG